MPAKSIGRLPAVASFCGESSATITSVIASAPNGTLNQNTHRHDSACTMKPPSSGPTIAATPHTAPKTPCMRARSFGGNMSPMIVIAIGCTPPAPMP